MAKHKNFWQSSIITTSAHEIASPTGMLRDHPADAGFAKTFLGLPAVA